MANRNRQDLRQLPSWQTSTMILGASSNTCNDMAQRSTQARKKPHLRLEHNNTPDTSPIEDTTDAAPLYISAQCQLMEVLCSFVDQERRCDNVTCESPGNAAAVDQMDRKIKREDIRLLRIALTKSWRRSSPRPLDTSTRDLAPPKSCQYG